MCSFLHPQPLELVTRYIVKFALIQCVEEFVCRYMCKDNLLKILTTLYLRKLNSIILHFGYVPKSKELIDCVKYRMQNNAFHILDMVINGHWVIHKVSM